MLSRIGRNALMILPARIPFAVPFRPASAFRPRKTGAKRTDPV